MTNEFLLAHREVVLFGFFVLVVAGDLFVRWQAFGRVESIAIDIAIFSTFYTAMALLKQEEPHGIWGVPWSIKFMLDFIFLIILTGSHAKLKEELGEKIVELFDELHETVSDAKAKRLVNAQRVIASYAIPVTLSRRYRGGKLRRRNMIVNSLKDAGLDPSNMICDDSFLLGQRKRFWMIVLFSALGSATLVIPVL